jgi:hypothetical protein
MSGETRRGLKKDDSLLQHRALALVLEGLRMKRIFPAALAALVLIVGSGCHYFPHFKRKPKLPKEDQAIAAPIEREFQKRWIEKRAGDLVAAGLAADAAHAQAAAEFQAQFSYAIPKQKP